MKKVLIFLVLVIMTLFTVAAQEITVGILEIETETFFLEDGKLKGSLGEQFQCILDNSELELIVNEMPTARVIEGLKKGDVDIAPAFYQNPDRDEFADFAVSLLSYPYVLVTKDSEITRDSDLSGKEIATLRGSNFIPKIKDLNAVEFNVVSYESALKMVIGGRKYAYLGPSSILSEFDEAELEGLNIVEWGSDDLGIYVSKKNPEYKMISDSLRNGLEKCK